MTKQEMIKRCMERIEAYRKQYSPKEQFEQMLADGIINEKGEVLMTREEREAGHPIEDRPPPGTNSGNGAAPR